MDILLGFRIVLKIVRSVKFNITGWVDGVNGNRNLSRKNIIINDNKDIIKNYGVLSLAKT